MITDDEAGFDAFVAGRSAALLQAAKHWGRIHTSPEAPVESLSLAVDLIPDLDGTSSQQLTHDFAASDRRAHGAAPALAPFR